MHHGNLKHADTALCLHAGPPFAPCKKNIYLCNSIRISHLACYSMF